MDDPRLPLDGLRVLDLTRVVAGPLATQTLADLGADVIKIERPGGGDDTRTWGPPWVGDASTYHLAVNRNKRSITLDLSRATNRTGFDALLADADVLVENFLPGSRRRLGMDHDALRVINPRLVHCSITAFGSQGPGADLPGYDLMMQAGSGLMHITGQGDGEPMRVGVAIVDVLTALHATIAVMSGLEKQRASGSGTHVEVALFDTAMATLLNQASTWLNAAIEPHREGNRNPSLAPYGVFVASDGGFILACGSDSQWRALCSAVDPALAEVDEWSTNAGRRGDLDRLETELNARFGTQPREAWFSRLSEAGVPAGGVNDIPTAFAYADSLDRDLVVEGPGYRGVANPIVVDGTRMGQVRRSPPPLDETATATWHPR